MVFAAQDSVLPTHLYCALSIVSNISLFELPEEDQVRTGFVFTLESFPNRSTICHWLHHWRSPGGETVLSYGREDAYHWLDFPGVGAFRISSDLWRVTGYPAKETAEETMRHLLLDQVLPRCLAHWGRIMLHASAVALEPGLVVFIGDSGAGKSTLAGDFHRAGQEALSDDCLWIRETDGQILAVPSYGGLRLWEDSLEALFEREIETRAVAGYSTKRRISLPQGDLKKQSRGAPVLAVIVLSPSGSALRSEILLEPLSPREAFIALHKQSFQLDPTDLERMTRHMRTLGRIVPRLKAFRLSLPHDYALLPFVRQKILEAVA